ncbi:carbohydrate deacetylase [Bryobacter aggregatus]|uniref:carbohydrate deacetylase n=1 Tax=Bryobacter aggregatus TaxID=360054 RepID=UPI00068C1E71|nr:ChbG/HpnK family deacetylase [Bryobacter aggregatus]
MRALVVNADDFGFTPDVNEGIIRAHRDGILTATTLMANGDAFEDAVRLADENPQLDIGVHLQMVQGKSLSQPERPLPQTVTVLMGELMAKRWDVYRELRAQVERILAAGITPTHLDTHKHTHLLPPVLDAVARLSEDFRISWVRRPFDLPMPGNAGGFKTRVAALVMRQMRLHFRRVLLRHHAKYTDHFAGFVWTGNYSADDLLRLFAVLPEGSTEFMAHPGVLGPDLAGAETRLKESRAEELKALTDPRLRPALAAAGIELGGYRMLERMRQANQKTGA